MKKLFLILLIFPFFAKAQHMSCCSAGSSTEKFAQLASNEKFAASHEAPVPFVFNSVKGSMVNYKTSDGKSTTSFEIPAATKSNNWLIVFHEWWGLNDYIKKEAEKLSDELPGVNIIAVDLYDEQIAATPDEAQTIMSSMKDERSRSIIQATFAHAGNDAKFATIGWCMGGGWSLQASIMAAKQGIGCVMYYGMPETNVDKLKTLNGDVLGLFAKRDEWINEKVVKTFEKNMKDADKNLTVKSYDADHAFANPSNPNHVKEATADAHEMAISFLRARLK